MPLRSSQSPKRDIPHEFAAKPFYSQAAVREEKQSHKTKSERSQILQPKIRQDQYDNGRKMRETTTDNQPSKVESDSLNQTQFDRDSSPLKQSKDISKGVDVSWTKSELELHKLDKLIHEYRLENKQCSEQINELTRKLQEAHKVSEQIYID